MKIPRYRYSFKKRTTLYILIGSFCVLLDYFTFIQFSKLIDPIYSNPLGYIAGSACSYTLNKKYTFTSQNTKLSLKRFCLIICIGLIASQIVIFFGLKILGMRDNISFIKKIAILASISLQYLGNTFWGSTVRK